MRKITRICHYTLLPICAFVLPACGQEPRSGSDDVAQTSQKVIGSPSNGTFDGSVVYFGSSSGTPVCAGVMIGPDLVLTSAGCAASIANTTLYVSSGTGSTFTNSLVSGSNVTLVASGVLELVHFNAHVNVSTFAPVSAAVVNPGVTTITAVGVNSSTLLRNSIPTIMVQGADPFTPQAEYCIGGNSTGFETPTDEGTPLFDSTGVIGVVDTAHFCIAQTQVDMIPAQGLPQMVTGQFIDGQANTEFSALLGNNGLFYEVSVYVQGLPGSVKADTGIPVAMAKLFAPISGSTPQAKLTKVTGGGTTSLKVAFDSPVIDPSGFGAGTLGDTTVAGDTSPLSEIPLPALPVDLGMSFVLSGSDVLDTSGSTPSLQPSWKGFPSAEANDGRFLTLRGAGFGTSQVGKFTGFIDCPFNTPFRIQVFDPDTTSDFDKPVTGVQSCIRLTVDPDKGGADGNLLGTGCVMDATESALFNTKNNQWYDVDSSTLSQCATNNPNRLDNDRSTYRLDVFFTTAGSCANAGTTEIPPGAINNFKIRSTCDIELTGQDFTLIANDLDAGLFSQPGVPATDITEASVQDTTYQRSGGMSYTVDVSGLSGTVHLKNLDADDCDISCSANGPSRNIHFVAFDSANTLAMRQQLDDLTPPTLGAWLEPVNWSYAKAGAVTGYSSIQSQNPSGQFNGLPSSVASEIGRFQVTAAANAQQIAVLWRNIRVENSFTVFHPNASPTIIPLLSNTSTWHPVIQAWTQSTWVASPAALTSMLPFEVGDPGGRKTATTLAAAQALLKGGDLTASLAAATLNVKRAHSRGRDLENAVIRNTNILVTDALADANHVLAGAAPTLPGLSTLLDTTNKGLFLFNYVNPELAPGNDPDLDGIPTFRDNCPVVYNPGQEDTAIFDDFTGDACDPTPIVECVQKHSTGHYTAFFGYNNPYRLRHLKNEFNRFLVGAADRGQPVLMLAGTHHNVFSVDFNGTPLSWKLAGNTVTASSSSPACTGGQETTLGADKNVALLASDSIQVGDRFKTTDLSALMAGANGISIGYGDTTHKVGDVFSTGNLTMRDRVDIEGSVRVNGQINYGAQDIIKGLALEHDSVQLPDISLSIANPPSRAPLTPIPNDGSRTLAPGNYQSLVVGDRATLTLSHGTYDFTELQINNDAHLVIDDSAGLVTIIVRTRFAYGNRATTRSPSGGNPQLSLEYLGTQTVQLTSTFAGSVLAPNAELDLVSGNSFLGTFQARRIVAGNDVSVTRVPLINN